MKFSSIILACLPSTLAASLAYNPPAELASLAKKHPQECILPNAFHIQNFEAHVHKNATSLTAYKFTYVNSVTNATTTCSFHGGLKAEAGTDGAPPRFACKAKDVNFVWANDQSKLTVVQKLCPRSPLGLYDFAASGTVFVPLTCAAGKCHSRKADQKGHFSKVTPLTHPSIARKKNRSGVAWAFDGYH
ncbi:hypothetical protein E4U41_001855 [Claviceps citrina]|nr:hypothetical protein E4U41_001855 [Claviceps citrina]